MVISLLENSSLKSIEKRKMIEEAINSNATTINDIKAFKNVVDDKKMAIILEAMEAVTAKNPKIADLEWLEFCQEFILSPSNNLKRESSRIVGNIAHLFPNDLEMPIRMLMANTKNDSKVIRWGSTYAFARIIAIPQHANSELYERLKELCEREQDNGVKNQLLSGLKKAKKLRN